jgi:hypothetical protein
LGGISTIVFSKKVHSLVEIILITKSVVPPRLGILTSVVYPSPCENFVGWPLAGVSTFLLHSPNTTSESFNLNYFIFFHTLKGRIWTTDLGGEIKSTDLFLMKVQVKGNGACFLFSPTSYNSMAQIQQLQQAIYIDTLRSQWSETQPEILWQRSIWSHYAIRQRASHLQVTPLPFGSCITSSLILQLNLWNQNEDRSEFSHEQLKI